MIRTFVSRPLWVKTHVANQLATLNIKLSEMGFEVKTIGANVTSFASPFEEVVEVLKTCQCAVILGLPLLRVKSGTLKDKEIENGFALPSEWNQIEAAISIMLGKPTLMMLHRGVEPRGLFDRGAANVFIHEFHTMGQKWIEDTVPKLHDLKTKVLSQQNVSVKHAEV
jgi:hypothetical protein